MSERFDISAKERGVIRLFTVDLPPDQIDAFSQSAPDPDSEDPPHALAQALGVSHLDSEFIELFPVSNLTGLGLSGYMVDGLGIAEADVAADKLRLDAITGHILIVLSSAFGGVEQTLRPTSPLRWIGTYVEETAPVQFKPLPDETAKGQVNTPAKAPPSNAAMSGRIATIVLIFLALFVGLLVWIAA